MRVLRGPARENGKTAHAHCVFSCARYNEVVCLNDRFGLVGAFFPSGRHSGLLSGQPAVIGVGRAVDTNESAIGAAAAIFAEYDGFIRTVIRFQAGKKLDVEDLHHEFFLALICRPIPADVRNIKGYLYQAIYHHVVNASRLLDVDARMIKKYAKERRIFINNEEPRNASIDEEQKDMAIASVGRYLQKREREAFLLKYCGDCSILEIATRMGINKRTAGRYVSEALRKLQRRLAAE